MTIDGTRARESFAAGANCAEAVISALECNGIVPAASGFTQGLGGSGCVCGALAAGVMAVSVAIADEELEPAATRAEAEALSAALHDRFRARWGSTCCRVLKRGHTEGTDAWTSHCAEIVESTAEMTRELLASRARTRAWTARDLSDSIRRTAADGLALAAAGALVAVVAGAGAAGVVFGAAVTGVVTGALLESRGTQGRRAGRMMRGAGLACAALLGVAAALSPASAAAAIASLLGASAPAVAARWAIGLLALLTALFRVFDLKRYR